MKLAWPLSRRHLGPLFGALVLTPGLLYLAVPLLFVSAVFSFGLATLHPFAAMLVPLGIGAAFASGGVSRPEARLAGSTRLALFAIAAGFGLLALLTSGSGDLGTTLFGEPCRPELRAPASPCPEREWHDLNWLVFVPALSHAPVALLGAATGNRRAATVLGVSALVIAGQVLLVSLLLLVYLAVTL
ncbi:MAG TPA: hypothetical protein VI789_01525 [Dehalococcoidia bacterium]|nr:hypothetical protein [Dehalococcoidia bacterium]